MNEFSSDFMNVAGSTIVYQQSRLKETEDGTATEISLRAAESAHLLQWFLATFLMSILFISLLQLHQRLQPPLLLLIIVLLLCLLIYRVYNRVVSVAGLGAQVTTKYHGGHKLVQFVPWSVLVDVIIAETISMQRVLFYIALLVKQDLPQYHEKHKMLPLFLSSWPRLPCLQVIYQSCQSVLLRRSSSAMKDNIRSPSCLSTNHVQENSQDSTIDSLGILSKFSNKEWR
ncbi:phosphatidylinositol N-acetylglucosaminyltransferase subunit H isoform X2 [Hyalella azteca]|uniref:Phosphatidylinositol N-acetylglucosaminyltransferase subunit H isoform X2 n=1 Tax=Hyalella azteca TaxID=294128 RepID=A0A979FNP4_HYAAZ|nr:phosphatidylinositol N-acetylglucosaminyltransferase subunit H isoform X2 [Hyalella azteca]